MARGALTCDVCGKECDEIVGKLYFSPVRRGQTYHHSKYTHHADVGNCCQARLLGGFKWAERTTAKEYHAGRRKNKKRDAA